MLDIKIININNQVKKIDLENSELEQLLISLIQFRICLRCFLNIFQIGADSSVVNRIIYIFLQEKDRLKLLQSATFRSFLSADGTEVSDKIKNIKTINKKINLISEIAN